VLVLLLLIDDGGEYGFEHEQEHEHENEGKET
jgi:hypothetical protein